MFAKKNRLFLTLTSTLLFSLLLGACGGATEVPAGELTGTLTVLDWAGYDQPDFWIDFQTTYPKVRIETLADTAPGSFKIGPFGSSLRKEELVSDGIPVVGIENVLANKFLPAFRKFITEEKFSQLSQYMIKSGDVLVTTMGTIGRAAVVPDSVDRTIIDSHLFRMRLDKAKVDPTYLCFAINGY